jgi:enoyl-CoA hydratase
MSYQYLIVERQQRVALITLNRPAQLNALCDALVDELGRVLRELDADPELACVVLTGSEKAFAAGADIAAMKDFDYMDAFLGDYITRNWEAVRSFRKPIIAAVSGYALGGGCELAMSCDLIVAGRSAKFGQPEVRLGILPGAGGTQRLTRAVGKSKAMDLCLTARMMDAEEAERSGLVARIVEDGEVIKEALAMARGIAGFSLPAVLMIKECVSRAFETPLSEGLLFERRQFHAAFALADQKEGMAAFVEKRPAVFKHR